MPWGSLYTLLHEGARVTVDTALALRLAVDVARAMSFLHSLERIIPQFHLNSHHIMVYSFFNINLYNLINILYTLNNMLKL